MAMHSKFLVTNRGVALLPLTKICKVYIPLGPRAYSNEKSLDVRLGATGHARSVYEIEYESVCQVLASRCDRSETKCSAPSQHCKSSLWSESPCCGSHGPPACASVPSCSFVSAHRVDFDAMMKSISLYALSSTHAPASPEAVR